jgi:hypothetical protein
VAFFAVREFPVTRCHSARVYSVVRFADLRSYHYDAAMPAMNCWAIPVASTSRTGSVSIAASFIREQSGSGSYDHGPNLSRYSIEFIKPLTIVRKSVGCVVR